MAEVDPSALSWLLGVGEGMRSGDPVHPTHAVLLSVEGNAVKVHSTDGYKMGFGEIESLTPGVETKHFISPASFTKPLSIMSEAETIELVEINGHLGMRVAGSVMVRPSLAGGPPPMGQLLEQARDTLTSSAPLTLPVSDFSDALSGVGLGKNGAILVEVQDDHVVVTNSKSASDLEGRTQVEVEADVPEGASGSTFQFNAANANAALKQFRTQDMSMTRNKRMVVLSEPDNGSRATPFIANIAIVQ